MRLRRKLRGTLPVERDGSLGAVLGVVVIALLIGATPAAAALSYAESSNTNTGGGNQGTATVECPGVSWAVGGGAFSTGGFAAVAITSSTPAGNALWSEETDVYVGPQSHRAYVICDTTEPSLEFNNASVPVNDDRTVRADCPSGENIYGGGFNSGASYGGSNTRSSRPFDDGDADRDRDDGWEATIFNFTMAPLPVTLYAHCGAKNSTVESRTREVTANSQKAVSESCRAGDHVTGGGTQISGHSSNTWISSSYPADAGDQDSVPDDRWSAYLENVTGKKREVTAYAVCR